MNGPRFEGLLQALQQAGVARHHARRALQEIGDHFEDLVNAARARGLDASSANLEAQGLLGAQADMVRAYAHRRELLTWSRRRPLIFFTLLPLLTYAATAVVSLLLLSFIADCNSALLHRLHLPAPVTRGMNTTAQVIYLWLLPWLISAAFASFAHRRRAPMRWSVIAIMGVCILASLCNVDVSITGGALPGEVGGGIGISWDTLPERLAHATLLAVPAVWLWRFAARQRGHSEMRPAN